MRFSGLVRDLEREWFRQQTNAVGMKHRGSLVSGRRTHKRNAAVGGHPRSRHLDGVGEDWIFDDLAGMLAAWADGRGRGLRGYYVKAQLKIHWQSRPARITKGRTHA